MAVDQSSKQTSVSDAGATGRLKAAVTTLHDYRNVLLKQRYLIEHEIGRGGIGAVLLARDRQLVDKPVVVKIMLSELEASQYFDYFRHKFQQEIKALARIDHPGIVGVLDAGETPDGKPFFVMQYVEGQSLRAALDSVHAAPRGLAFARAAALIRQIGQALSAAHDKGIHHRDLKPENIMLQDLGRGEELVKLIDFGMATVKDSQTAAQTAVTKVAGTLPYMAPEQLRGKPSALSDVFAFGVIAYEILTGYLPFKSETPVQQYELQRAGVAHQPGRLRVGLPAAAQTALLKALAFDAEDRYQNARTFGDDLAESLLDAVELEQQSVEYGSQDLPPVAGAHLSSGKRRAHVHNFDTPQHVARVTEVVTAPQAPARWHQRSQPRLAVVAAAMVVGMLAAFWVVSRWDASLAPPPPKPTPSLLDRPAPPALTFSFALQVQRYRNGKPYKEPYQLSGTESFNLDDGDRVRFDISSPQMGYLYLVNEGPQTRDGLPDYNLLFPAAQVNGGAALLEAGRTLQIPDAAQTGLRLNTQHGAEKIWLLWSAQPLDAIEGMRARLKQIIAVQDAADTRALQQLLATHAHTQSPLITRDGAPRTSTVTGRGPVLAASLSFEHH